MKRTVYNGADRLAAADKLLRGRRLGLITNPTGVRRDLVSTIDVLHEQYCLTALYSPEHGVRGDAQGGVMIPDGPDPLTGVMNHSLYGTTRRLTPAMVKDVDVIVVDIQDVGARFYTYLYTMAYAMEACKAMGLPMVLLDRIDPIGGVKVEGTRIEENCRSFAGDYALPARTGVTLGEMARYLAGTRPGQFGCELTVVPVEGWTRDTYADETDLSWVIPSPNLPTIDQAEIYIGTCPLEGTNVSEGRGTTTPYMTVGAPWMDGHAVAEAMNARHLPGVRFRAGCFTPTSRKYAGQTCYSVTQHLTDRRAYRSFETGLLLIETIRALHPGDFTFNEAVDAEGITRYRFDELLGTDAFRTGRMTAEEILRSCAPGVAAYREEMRPYLLYE